MYIVYLHICRRSENKLKTKIVNISISRKVKQRSKERMEKIKKYYIFLCFLILIRGIEFYMFKIVFSKQTISGSDGI